MICVGLTKGLYTNGSFRHLQKYSKQESIIYLTSNHQRRFMDNLRLSFGKFNLVYQLAKVPVKSREKILNLTFRKKP